MATKDGILLESGTDEVEILEFILGGKSFGVNVLKIQSIEQFDQAKLTKLPTSNPVIAGMFLFRGNTIPVLDLTAELGLSSAVGGWDMENEGEEDEEQRIVLVTQFNSMTNAFLVDGVRRIYRVNWSDITPMSDVFTDQETGFTGSVNIEDREILIVDMERISDEYFPAKELLDLTSADISHPRQAERPNIKILLAEDSHTVQTMILSVLEKGGYTNVQTFENGKTAYDAVCAIKEQAEESQADVTDALNLVITDIEMPQMDGLTLCHHIKYAMGMDNVCVILYSSLTKEQMSSKCKDVKADAYITKPDCIKLVGMVDRLCLDGLPAED